ncbi:CatB-related O-acetyltransferase [Methylosinus sp. LW4]|uniref:CatB-related O-acetyltransferase n=1 Tax=Methylosinus sp. LW4 TaxID=136993 RepID=UPI000A05A3E4|nr:CatB-related O-acetyltransferase [Methylosinus sp. LW4]
MNDYDEALGIVVTMTVGNPIYVESYVRLVSGTVFPPAWFGRRSYVNDAVIREGTRIGRYCSIARRVTIGAQRHPLSWLSTHPFQKEGRFSESGREFLVSPTTIGSDVWICENAVITAGVTIGDGAVIGAGAVVTHDVPSYAVVAGVPAREIRRRFDDLTVSRLCATRWWEIDEEFLITLPFEDVEKCLDLIDGAFDLDSMRRPMKFNEYSCL